MVAQAWVIVVLTGLILVTAAALLVALHRLSLARADAAQLRAQHTALAERQTTTAAELARWQALAAAAQADNAMNERRVAEATARIEERTRSAEELERKTDDALRAAAAENARLTEANMALGANVAELAAKLTAERANSEEKLSLLTAAREQLGTQFKLLAADILEEKRKAFTDHSQATLDTLLKPLGTSMDEFRKRIDQLHSEESQQRASLSKEVRMTLELNQTLAKDAKELTRALKGSTKVQGNWGERVLESVLEASGLRRGHEYEAQVSARNEDGSRSQPDVVVNLPGARHLIVDAKVSLTAYQEHQSAESDAERDAALKRHIDSLRAHIRGLSAKAYQDLYGLRTLDFVLLFVPIEPAFMLAAQSDRELFEDAWNKNIILVSPSTLLFVLRTVASLWRQEQQSQNAQEIARRGGELYDKLVGFVTELDKLGNNLTKAHTSFSEVRAMLATGHGNVIRRAERLRELGLKPAKQLPVALVDKATQEDDAPALARLEPALNH